MRRLHEQCKTRVEVAQITGYARSYVMLMLKRIADAPHMIEGMSRGGRPPGSRGGHSAKEERRPQVLICGKCPGRLSMPFALWTRGAIHKLIHRESIAPAQ
jgi:hypothetical protein